MFVGVRPGLVAVSPSAALLVLYVGEVNDPADGQGRARAGQAHTATWTGSASGVDEVDRVDAVAPAALRQCRGRCC